MPFRVTSSHNCFQNKTSHANVNVLVYERRLMLTILSRIFQRNISANILSLVGMVGGWAGGFHNKVKVFVKVLFSDNNSDVLNEIG